MLYGIHQNALKDVLMFPNPTAGIMKIENAENADLKLYNLMGQVLLSRKNISTDETLSLDQLGNGLYYLQLVKSNARVTQKVILSKD